MTNYYLREVNDMLRLDEGKAVRKKEGSNAVVVQNGNDVIIQPKRMKEHRGLVIVLDVALGLAIGVLIGWFLLAPIRMKMSDSGVEKELDQTRAELAEKSASLEELSQNYEKLSKQYDETAASLESYEGTDGENSAVKNLMLAQIEYDKGDSRDPMVIAGYISNIQEEYVQNEATEEFKTMYDLMLSSVGGVVGEQYYQAGNDAFRIADYTTAIENYKKAVSFDSESCDALFALADAYRMNGDKIHAIETYASVISRFPDTENATRSQGFIAELGE